MPDLLLALWGIFSFQNQWPLKWPRSLWTFLPSTSTPSTCSLPSQKRKQQPTWRGGLVDDCISLSLRNNSVTHSQQREELLYMYSCGLDRTPGEWGLALHTDFTKLRWTLVCHRKKTQSIFCSLFIAVVLTSEHQDSRVQGQHWWITELLIKISFKLQRAEKAEYSPTPHLKQHYFISNPSFI